jgi:hypothetical protein
MLVTCFHAGVLLGLFDPEAGGDMFLQNVGWLSTDYTALHNHRCESLKTYIVRGELQNLAALPPGKEP